MSDMKYVPVDFGEHIVPLGKVNHVGIPSDEVDKQYLAVIDTDTAELYTTLSKDDCLQRMYNAIRMFLQSRHA